MTTARWEVVPLRVHFRAGCLALSLLTSAAWSQSPSEAPTFSSQRLIRCVQKP